MRFPSLCRGFLCLTATAAFLTPTADAQVCQDPGDTFWKNDTLDDVVVGVPPEAYVAIAICNLERVGTYFKLPPGSPPQYIKQVSVGYAHTGGETNHGALLSIEIYEGEVTFNPGFVITMGTKIFDLREDHNLSMSVMSTGITSYDLTQYNIVVDDDFTVVYRMVANLDYPGCPDAIPGTPANFLTDSKSSCTPGINVFEEKFTGWVDPADWQWTFLQTICPTYFTGNFTIRACTADAGTWTDLGNGLAGSFGVPSLVGSGPLTVGTFNPIVLSNTLPLSPTFLVLGFSAVNLPLKGGILVPAPDLLIGGIPTDASGGWSFAGAWPAGVPSGFTAYFQVWIPDGAGVAGFAATNAEAATAP
jgi:hypothetical protein